MKLTQRKHMLYQQKKQSLSKKVTEQFEEFQEVVKELQQTLDASSNNAPKKGGKGKGKEGKGKGEEVQEDKEQEPVGKEGKGKGKLKLEEDSD